MARAEADREALALALDARDWSAAENARKILQKSYEAIGAEPRLAALANGH
jgi:hypothetical protein